MMNTLTREIEKKFLVKTSSTIVEVFADLITDFSVELTDITVGSGTDFFFKTDKVSILRVREYDEGGGEITIKTTDKTSIVDREEINIKLKTKHDVDMSKLLLTRLYGEATNKVWKKYYILWFKELNANIVVYQTNLKKYGGIILEIEAESLRTIEKLQKRLGHYNLLQMQKSLYQMTVEDQENGI